MLHPEVSPCRDSMAPISIMHAAGGITGFSNILGPKSAGSPSPKSLNTTQGQFAVMGIVREIISSSVLAVLIISLAKLISASKNCDR
ncbi:hypothetical protein EV361DRAFT_912872 [Lentinula raphanica]|uniref:Uncharacterized protein n=1 Tax=Lentinula raphanica TaxID=153919 RepID=A0AA38P2L7_9AGAR|nr:hypothetical protein C8R42DRAFT_336105 [Lentinula raphanica]KAJ3835076.1 hypothetical protein F5878DRAFT_628907 [Lentinula raphanica]KAJ3971101.1 hypothetical protein EV361DRAFT_912872 [Lentinula raphanica]